MDLEDGSGLTKSKVTVMYSQCALSMISVLFITGKVIILKRSANRSEWNPLSAAFIFYPLEVCSKKLNDLKAVTVYIADCVNHWEK